MDSLEGQQACGARGGVSSAQLATEAGGATVAPVRLDDEGLTLSDSPLKGARLVYVTPAHQFPLGVSMSLPRRLALLRWARTAGRGALISRMTTTASIATPGARCRRH